MGYALFAARDIAVGECLGEYTGMIQPSTIQSESDFRANLTLGEDDDSGSEVFIDAERKGSVWRFLQHSCSANVQIDQARVGMKRQVLVAWAPWGVKEGEVLTMDYGWNWPIENEPCYCGEGCCRNPAKPGAVQHEDGGEGEDVKMSGNEDIETEEDDTETDGEDEDSSRAEGDGPRATYKPSAGRNSRVRKSAGKKPMQLRSRSFSRQ